MGINIEWIINKARQKIYAVSHAKAVIRGNHTVDEDLTDIETTLRTHTHDERYYITSEIDIKLKDKVDMSMKGQINGLAELDNTGKVPYSQLPSDGLFGEVPDEYILSLFSNPELGDGNIDIPTTSEVSKAYVDAQDSKVLAAALARIEGTDSESQQESNIITDSDIENIF